MLHRAAVDAADESEGAGVRELAGAVDAYAEFDGRRSGRLKVVLDPIAARA